MPAGGSRPSLVLSPRPGVPSLTPGPFFIGWCRECLAGRSEIPFPRNPPRVYSPRERAGFRARDDLVSDGHGGTYAVVAAAKGRLLLRDSDGTTFPLSTFRLNHQRPEEVCVPAWHLVTTR